MPNSVSEMTNEELVEQAGSGPLGSTAGQKAFQAQAELVKRLIPEVTELRESMNLVNSSINSLDKTTKKYSTILIWLTVIMAILTFAQVLFLIH